MPYSASPPRVEPLLMEEIRCESENPVSRCHYASCSIYCCLLICSVCATAPYQALNRAKEPIVYRYLPATWNRGPALLEAISIYFRIQMPHEQYDRHFEFVGRDTKPVAAAASLLQSTTPL